MLFIFLRYPTPVNANPGTFLNGDYNNGNETDEQRLRCRLQYFGNDPLNTKTNVIPILFARNGDASNCTAADGFLGNLLLGQCNWARESWPEPGGTAGENYLPEVEEEFIKQFFDYNLLFYLDCDGVAEQDEPYCNDPVYGNANIYNGFFWHGYGMPADGDFQGMSYPPRNGDKRNARKYLTAYRPMNAATEIGTEKNETDHKASNTSDLVMLWPNPVTRNAKLIIDKDIKVDAIKVTDMLGRNEENNFELIKTEGENSYLITPKTVGGIFILNISTTEGWQKIIKFSVTR